MFSRQVGTGGHARHGTTPIRRTVYPQDVAYQNQRRAPEILGRYAFDDIAEVAAHPILVWPGGPMHHRNRAVRAVVRHQLSDNARQVLDPR